MGTKTALLDLAPAIVETPEKTYRGARIFIDGGRARVFVVKGRSVELALEADGVTDVKRPQFRKQPHEVSFADGSMWLATRAGGCACGSPLKRFDPGTWQ